MLGFGVVLEISAQDDSLVFVLGFRVSWERFVFVCGLTLLLLIRRYTHIPQPIQKKKA